MKEGLWVNADEVLATRFVLFNQAVMIRREVLERIGGFDESIKYLEDYELPLRLSLEGPWAFIEEPLVIWRESATNSVYKNTLKDELCTSECQVEIMQRHLARVEKAGGNRRLRACVRFELNSARRHLWAVRRRQASSAGATLAGFMGIVERYRSALFRRSPWFPKMKTALVSS